MEEMQMDTVQLIIMNADEKGGFTQELCRVSLMEEDLSYIQKVESWTQEEKKRIRLLLTVGEEVEEQDFYDIYGYYDEEQIAALPFIRSICEAEEASDPEWEVVMDFTDWQELERNLKELLFIHRREMQEVWQQIQEERS